MSGFILSMGITGIIAYIALKNFDSRKGNSEIVLELDERYKYKNDMIKETVKRLEKKGKKCNYVGEDKIEIDGEGYKFSEREISMGRIPLQQIVLKHI
ncbi:hypothetical protein [uncultured Clostridium sp.]|jgi:hypothetical protein|uniref:hypothetical protein n=1 Tax=uncultured Clostridium sp. TaxID=59620 RepID=UPI002616522D|nr:hypothetical protein [uncultured Clostridium sp.]